jgi:hypothetical protein
MEFDEAFAMAMQMQEDEADEFYKSWRQAERQFGKRKRRRHRTATQDPYQMSLGFNSTACLLI